MTISHTKSPVDFDPIWRGETNYAELATTLTLDQLRSATQISIDFMLGLLDGLTDADVVYEPIDESADDPYAVAGEENIGWNLAHLIAHVTASTEEGAVIAARLARGVVVEGRDRYETPWRDITTVADCRQRLEESLRMRLALFDVWPDEPQLNVCRKVSPRLEARTGKLNAPAAFLFGFVHEVEHYDQMAATRQEAINARVAQPS